MAVKPKIVTKNSNSNETTAYVVNINEDGVYGILINVRDTLKLRTKSGEMKTFTTDEELLMRIFKKGITSIQKLKQSEDGSQEDLNF